MTHFARTSLELRGEPEPAIVFLRSLERETRRTLSGNLELEGQFLCNEEKVERAVIQTEGEIRYLTLNISLEALGKLARGHRHSSWSDKELGKALLTDIVESTKSLKFGSFKIFAEEQNFLIAAITLGREGPYREFGRIHDNSFLRFVFEIQHTQSDYASSYYAHFMDRLTTMIGQIERYGFLTAARWADFLNAKELNTLKAPRRIVIPEVLSTNSFRILLEQRLDIDCNKLHLPADVELCQDNGHNLMLRVPVADAFLNHYITREKNINALGVLEGLRLSVQNEFDQNGLSKHVRVHLRNSSEISRLEPEDGEDLMSFLSSKGKSMARYLICFAVELPGSIGSSQLRAARSNTIDRLLSSLTLFKHCLGR